MSTTPITVRPHENNYTDYFYDIDGLMVFSKYLHCFRFPGGVGNRRFSFNYATDQSKFYKKVANRVFLRKTGKIWSCRVAELSNSCIVALSLGSISQEEFLTNMRKIACQAILSLSDDTLTRKTNLSLTPPPIEATPTEHEPHSPWQQKTPLSVTLSKP